MKADVIFTQQVTTEASCVKWIQWASCEARARGVQWARVSFPPERRLEMWFEGWLVKPDDNGPEPWKRYGADADGFETGRK